MSSNSQSLRHQTSLALLQPIEAELEMLLGSVMGHLSRARHKMRGALRPLAKSELA